MSAVAFAWLWWGRVWGSLMLLIIVGLLLGVAWHNWDCRRQERREAPQRHPAGKSFEQHVDEALAIGDDWRHDARRELADLEAAWSEPTYRRTA